MSYNFITYSFFSNIFCKWYS